MNYIRWTQLGTFSFLSDCGNFTINPESEGGWRLTSKQKGKQYVYTTLDGAFEGARNIANFYRR